jgi:hypothetical protein
MKRMGMFVLALGLLAFGANAQDAPAKPATPPAKAPAKAPAAGAQAPAAGSGFKTQKERVSYAIGLEMGKGVKTQGIDVDPSILSQGLKDSLSGAKPQLSDDEVKQIITDLQQQVRQKQMQIQEAAGAENKKKGDAFLAENSKKDGVVALADGLQYKILKAGDGKKPAETERDSRIQGSPATYAGRFQVAGLHSVKFGLRRAGGRERNSAKLRARFRY